jgi:hypothetical protein
MIKKLSFIIETDKETTEFGLWPKLGLLTPEVPPTPEPTPPPIPEPIPTPPLPPPIPKKHVLLNCINWNATGLNTLPLDDATEFTYFVLRVNADGTLKDGNATLESKFVTDVHAKGKKATFSIAGGTQNVADITAAVNEKFKLVNNIKAHMEQFGYDGVTVNIENTNIAPQAMKDFIIFLRTALGDKIIGCYTQGYQLNTVWAKIAEYKDAFTWVSMMYYDSGVYSKDQFIALTKQWEARVGKDRLLAGVAVNYPANSTGLSTAQFSEVLDIVNAEGWKGVGIWQNVIYTEPWRQVRRLKLTNI